MRKSARSSRPAGPRQHTAQEYFKTLQYMPKLAALASRPPHHHELSEWLTDFLSISIPIFRCPQIIFGPLPAENRWPLQSAGSDLVPAELLRDLAGDLTTRAKIPYRAVKLGEACSKTLQRRYPSLSQATLQALRCGAFWAVIMPPRTQVDKSLFALAGMLLDSALLASRVTVEPSPSPQPALLQKRYEPQNELPGLLICSADLQPLYANDALQRWAAPSALSFSTPSLSHLYSLIKQQWTTHQPAQIDFDLQTQISMGGNGYAQILPFTVSEKEYIAVLVYRGVPLSTAQKELTTATIDAALSRLAGGLIHELNNPTTSILNYARLLQMKNISNEESQEFNQSIADEAERMAALTHNMQLSMGDDAAKFQRVSLNHLLSTVLDLHRSRFSRDHLTLEYIIDDALPEVLCRKDQLIAAFSVMIHNAQIALNARFANEIEGKILRISMRSATVRGKQVVQIVVTDNGIGLASNIESLIFTPFFSAWTDKRRAGMGLFVGRSIARAHEGDLVLLKDSQLRTSFALHLPTEQ